ncbi:hypothetical protein A3715_05180 [Oleiphilus sp. HI0009]|uniref:CmcJ/NvfI family oxidoreductase n=1 Tax=Oleiphilus sp. HI0125 TaxID=1822266 RepID=UPI0007C381E2|nr:CmcJ/NvfI family oxidoreductase [Oleiphilus sp. HI0125]KZX83159.1 hypothetical protein A3715_05180 [Oleiphilus sp. HI0009]KZZ59260.1 hypothetical protein A3762_05240 [Oleiphilus sp. HI0125]
MHAEYRVNYATPGIDHVYDQTHLGPGSEQLIDSIDRRVVSVKDGRLENETYSLDKNGFELTNLELGFSDYENDEAIQSVLYPKVAEWLRSRHGANVVKVFDHTYRSMNRNDLSVHNRAPVKTVHNDYTSKSADYRRLEETKLDLGLRSKRYKFINLWIPVHHKVEESPLAMVDMRTVGREDYHPLKLVYPDRTGELAAISYNPKHQWIYFSDMEPGEALLLKVFDSQMPSDLNGVPHSAADEVVQKEYRNARNSIELRTIAFFED